MDWGQRMKTYVTVLLECHLAGCVRSGELGLRMACSDFEMISNLVFMWWPITFQHANHSGTNSLAEL